MAVCAKEALEKLKQGNAKFLKAEVNGGNVCRQLRARTAQEGQAPYAVVLCCSDSRVLPESIFQAGIGELFVIRVAGNVAGNHALGSIEYALSHLGCKLVLVLGHNRCGAVGAALSHPAEGHVKSIVEEILLAAQGETNEDEVCRRNVLHTAKSIVAQLNLCGTDVEVVGGVYRLETGEVQFL